MNDGVLIIFLQVDNFCFQFKSWSATNTTFYIMYWPLVVQKRICSSVVLKVWLFSWKTKAFCCTCSRVVMKQPLVSALNCSGCSQKSLVASWCFIDLLLRGSLLELSLLKLIMAKMSEARFWKAFEVYKKNWQIISHSQSSPFNHLSNFRGNFCYLILSCRIPGFDFFSIYLWGCMGMDG